MNVILQGYLIIVGILVTHFIADFVLQTNWMAKNKSSSMDALASHILTYTAALFVGTLLIGGLGNIVWVFMYAVLNGIIHGVVDYFTSRISKRYWNAAKVHVFFVVIGADQLIHTVTLIGTLLGMLVIWPLV